MTFRRRSLARHCCIHTIGTSKHFQLVPGFVRPASTRVPSSDCPGTQ
ncbi:hypothetical protein [Halogranum rubrum]